VTGRAQGGESLYTVQKVAEILRVDDTFVLKLHLDEKTRRIAGGSCRAKVKAITSLMTMVAPALE
jgi:hypothetical protein